MLQSLVIIKGNHDPITKFVVEKRGVEVIKEFRVGDTLIVHGDELIDLKEKKNKNLNRIIIGHEHPAITIREGSKYEKYKCFLKGKWKGIGIKEKSKSKELLVLPSFNPLLEGTDVLKEQLLSPFLQNIKTYKVYIVHKGKVFDFGRVKDIEGLDNDARRN